MGAVPRSGAFDDEALTDADWKLARRGWSLLEREDRRTPGEGNIVVKVTGQHWSRTRTDPVLALTGPRSELLRTKNEVVSVANIKSQIKRNKQNVVLRERNRAVKSELRTRAKNAVAAVGTEDEEANLRMAIKRIDMAASKGIIHKNQAANKKSGLMKRVNALRAEA
jgi:small subunit ribosomal protein S20